MRKYQSLMAILVLLVSFTVGAKTVKLPEAFFEVQTSNGLDKIEDVLFNPESLLIRYAPTGAVIKEKTVNNGQFQFKATKNVFMISKTVFVHGVLDVVKSKGCEKSENAYLATMDFSGSDQIVTDNVEKYEALICVTANENVVKVQVKSKIYQALNYKSIVGRVITDIIAAQSGPLVAAMSAELKMK